MTVPPNEWILQPPYTKSTVIVTLAIVVAVLISGRRTEMDRAAVMTSRGVLDGIGMIDESQVGHGWNRFVSTAFPLVLDERRAVSRIQEFDDQNLPMFSYLVEEPIREFDFETNEFRVVGTERYLVQPGGYIVLVAGKIVETIEIALWGTLLSVLLALPMAYLSASNYSPHKIFYLAGRGVCSLTRSIPDLILAMFLVLMYGFGPIAGVLALAIHTSGFLGKFFADDIENCDRGPQDALLSTGASKLKVLRIAVIPQIFPQCFSYIQYILERNVRMATVLGIVGAGGIGMELKGRWDMSDFGHVSTILVGIFLVVLGLELLTQRLRKRVIE